MDGQDQRAEQRDAFFEELIDELQIQARTLMRKQPAGHTLQPTALVNEVYVKLSAGERVKWNNRAHFLGHASQAMRSILIDHARAKNTQKRKKPEKIQQVLSYFEDKQIDILELEEALQILEEQNPQTGKVAELRYYAGATIQETAEALDISPATVERKWNFARAYLKAALS